jgi:hypothetical protein
LNSNTNVQRSEYTPTARLGSDEPYPSTVGCALDI